ncbi:MAG: hypothetical protein FWC84_07865, partial [Alphaproteobacteria bacterium]|nr:hypothetical protein [Alphaproteobacteria bacterium]
VWSLAMDDLSMDRGIYQLVRPFGSCVISELLPPSRPSLCELRNRLYLAAVDLHFIKVVISIGNHGFVRWL